MKKTVFFHMNQLGDLMFSLPLLKAARAMWPHEKLVSVVRPELASLLEATGLLDTVWRRERKGIARKLSLLRRIRQERFSQGVFFSESPEVLLSGFLSGIPERIGFETAGFGFFLTKKAGRSGVPSLANNENLARCAGLDNVPPDYAGIIDVPRDAAEKVRRWLADESIVPSRLAVVAPGTSKRRREKCWPNMHWISLLDFMVSHAVYPVLTGSPSEQEDLERLAVSASQGVRVFPAAPDILSVAALYREAKVFVGVDSGAMHLAAGVGTPVVALFGPTDPAQVGPRPPGKHAVIKRDRMSDIMPDEVWQTVSERMG